jgi:hypothetical protein
VYVLAKEAEARTKTRKRFTINAKTLSRFRAATSVAKTYRKIQRLAGAGQIIRSNFQHICKF